MLGFIRHELRRLFSPSFIITIILVYAIAWRMMLPPFMYRTIYQTDKLLITYEYVIQYAGFVTFYFFSFAHFSRVMDIRYRVQLATRISGAEFIHGLIVIYFFFLTFGIVLTGYASAITLQFLYAPGQIEWQVLCIRIASYPIFFQFALFMLAIPLFIRGSSEYGLLIITLIIQTTFFLADRFIISSVLIPAQIPWLISALSALLIAGSALIILRVIAGLKNTALYINDIRSSQKNLAGRFFDSFGLHISAIHIRIMGLSAQKVTIGICLFISIALVIINRAFSGQVRQLVDIFNVAILPLLFAGNLEEIFRPEKNLQEKDQILVRQISYSRIVFNRYLIHLGLQLFCGFCVLGITAMFSHSFNLAYIIYYVLFQINISLTIFFLRIYSGSKSLALFSLLLMVYLQLNTATAHIFRSTILLSYFNINIMIHNSVIDLELSRITLLVAAIAGLIYFCHRILREKQYAVTDRFSW